MREPLATHASSIGSFAADIATGGGEAEVIALFERSFYVLCDKGIVAVCVHALGNGPLNILVPAAEAGTVPWRGRVRVGMKGTIDAMRLVYDGAFSVDLGAATPWSPPAWPIVDDPHMRAASLEIAAYLGVKFATASDDMGLAPLMFAPQSRAAASATARAAKMQLAALQTALPGALASRRWSQGALDAATLLVGLGPGLTPSGDDLLGGLLLALTARGEIRLRDQLFDHIVDELNELTVPVSAMHLTAAAHGMGHESVHALLDALASGERTHLAQLIDAVAALGATSGSDTIAGIVLGLSSAE